MDRETETNSTDEIEITPEMIDAGVLRLYDYDPRYANERDIVAGIYSAMTKVRT